jgi:TatD DNase family protein
MRIEGGGEADGLQIVDVHAHLDQVPKAAEALEVALRKGVKAVVGVGMDRKSSLRILELARLYPGFVFAAIGIHPWSVNPKTAEDEMEFVAEHISSCVAVGEIGLDYKIKVEKSLQKRIFEQLLVLARDHGKPVITHSRLSHQSTLDMVIEAGVRKAIFHWYSGPLDLVEKIVAQGYLISATPALAYSPSHQAAVKEIPLQNLVLETDCPVQYGNLDSLPEHAFVTLDLVARLKGADHRTVAVATTQNAERFFGFSVMG